MAVSDLLDREVRERRFAQTMGSWSAIEVRLPESVVASFLPPRLCLKWDHLGNRQRSRRRVEDFGGRMMRSRSSTETDRLLL